MTITQQSCQRELVRTVNALCSITQDVSPETARQLLQVPAIRHAEAQADQAALAGNLRACRRACKQWWQAWQLAVAQAQNIEKDLSPIPLLLSGQQDQLSPSPIRITGYVE